MLHVTSHARRLVKNVRTENDTQANRLQLHLTVEEGGKQVISDWTIVGIIS